jgi:hypothetical protein
MFPLGGSQVIISIKEKTNSKTAARKKGMEKNQERINVHDEKGSD